MSGHSHHETHHRLINERSSDSRLDAKSPQVHREAYKRALWSVKGHLQCCHDVGHLPANATLEDLLAQHADSHEVAP